ncbi:MAG: hypothetical protein ACI35R_08360 [Bacillus sp. (in: firmicutes)]
MKELYTTTDKAIALLRRKAVRKFQQAKQEAYIAGFDELNIIKAVDGLYESLAKDNKSDMLTLAKEIYMEAEPHGNKKPDAEWLMAIFEEPNPVTLYSYSTEVVRKKERLKEAALTNVDKTQEWKKALSLWSNMTAQYCDIVTDEAVLKAFKEAGVNHVRWITRDDELVCKDCNKRKNKVYSIENAPPKEHWHCRCYYVPAD